MTAWGGASMRRREMLAGLPAGVALAGATLTVPRGLLADDPLHVMAWEGYEDPLFHGAYLARGTVAPEFEALRDGTDALAKLRAGYAADVAQPCLYELGAWIDAGVVRPMETAALSHWPELWRPLKVLCGGPTEGTVWFAPFDWGPASIIYRTDLVERPEASWWMMYDDRFSGRLAMQRSAEAAVGCAALALGIGRPAAMDEAERRAVAGLIARQRALVGRFWNQAVEVEAGLESGAIVASYGWNDIYARLRARGVPVAFMAPREGFLIWVCGLASIASGRAGAAAAQRFVDAMLSPAAGAALIARFGYGHANRHAFDLVPGEVLSALALDAPAAMLGEGLVLERMTGEERAGWQDLFDGAMSAS